MSDLATLLLAIGGMVGTILGGVAGLVTALKTSGRERPAAATNVAKALADAAKDGELTQEEIDEALQKFRDEEGS